MATKTFTGATATEVANEVAAFISSRERFMSSDYRKTNLNKDSYGYTVVFDVCERSFSSFDTAELEGESDSEFIENLTNRLNEL